MAEAAGKHNRRNGLDRASGRPPASRVGTTPATAVAAEAWNRLAVPLEPIFRRPFAAAHSLLVLPRSRAVGAL